MTDEPDDAFFDGFWPVEPSQPRRADPAWVTACRDQLYAGVRELTSGEALAVLYAIAGRLYERGNVEAATALRQVVITLDGWAFELAFRDVFGDGTAA